MVIQNDFNTLQYDPALCVGCGMCIEVCPQAVFAIDDNRALIVRARACMECGACMTNCAFGAITVESGVGCAAAMINAALKGSPTPTCGDDDCCCC